ncbi:sugar phosphate isomerase/epimerase family protein [Microlunatus speluncae]|uniref:sugar phosphate isomerase/epimerase family protein n=1 Tax=Microlunatus speluncae TaxID=2594267 RepID=UPI0012663B4F|nr:sugar phosphate isomerase/epimerase family protein [Microlunatus speluncae]
MRFGFSSYSFNQRLSTGEMTVFDVLDWAADSEGEHLEFAAIYGGADSPVPSIESDPAFVDKVVKHAADRGVTLSNLAIGASFLGDDAENAAEVERVKANVDLAERLGIKLMRHDVVRHAGLEGDDTPLFEEALPKIVAASKEIAQYAATKGVTTSLENHGFFVQSSDRVRRIVHAVDEPNFKTTLDIGNFICVDEDSTVAVPANLPYAMIVHFKDFYIRPADRNPGEGWFRSRGGKYLRGAIVGNGDLDTWSIAKSIKDSGYDGFASIEFEGHEDCLIGCARGIANAKRIYEEA